MSVLRPRTVRSTGDDTPATTLRRYIWRMSEWHQLALAAIALATAALAAVPLQLQQRIVDDAIRPGDTSLLIKLLVIYAAAILLQQTLKVMLRLYQSWVGHSAVAYSRSHFASLQNGRSDGGEHNGENVAVLTAEIEKLGRYAGFGPSDALVSVATIIVLIGYMAFVEPMIVLLCLPFLVAQFVTVPLFQRKLDTLIERRIGAVRRLAERSTPQDTSGAHPDAKPARAIQHIYSVSLLLEIWKVLMKATINTVGALGPLAVLAVGGWLAIRGDTTVGVVVAFMTGFMRLADPARDVVQQVRQAAQARVQHQMVATALNAATSKS